MARRVKFGFGLDFRNPPMWPRPWVDLYQDYLDFAVWLESLGFDYVWLPEHHGIEEDGYPPSPFVIATALAARTKTLRIGTTVALAPFYHPVRLAEDCAVLDIISNGRLEPAFGLGYLEAETDAYGIGFKSRNRQTDEFLQIVRKLWDGEEVSWKSEFFDLKKAKIFPRPIQEGNIPLLVGATAAPGFRRAALYGDGYSGPIQNWPAYVEEVRAAGRDISKMRYNLCSAYDMWTYVAEDPDKAFYEIAPYADYNLNTYARWQEGKDWGVKKMDVEELRRTGMVKVMTPDEAIPHLEQLFAQAPVDSFFMKMPTGMPFEKFAPYVELFARKVLPTFT
jgi:alkanesulfonate monooxygenase SsuD/methylene tetrahydromethanopterin reductase-like flavin-dependent oxidoreductase (luciferase family)